MNKMIYLTDDDEQIRELLMLFFKNEGFEIHAFINGEELMSAMRTHHPDLVVLDIMMPGRDGLQICRDIKREYNIPVILISAKGTPLDRVTGLTMGSDDYITKPFLPQELIVKAKKLLAAADAVRMSEPETVSEEVWIADLRIIPAVREAYIGSAVLQLTPLEFDCLYYLVKHKETAVRKQTLLKEIWKYQNPDESRTPDTLIKRLRKKLYSAGTAIEIKTIWGYGYRVSEVSDAS